MITIGIDGVSNVGVAHGIWGEDVAVEFLIRKGWRILERNIHPAKYDKRLEIDIVALDKENETIVFVEVKQHAMISKHSRRLRSVNLRKRKNLLRAFNAWRRNNHWKGGYRFDVVEIYGVPEGGSPIIDHIDHVAIWRNAERFVKW